MFDNAAWGMLKAFQRDVGYNDLDAWNFADIATALGGKGTSVATRKALAAAIAKKSALRKET